MIKNLVVVLIMSCTGVGMAQQDIAKVAPEKKIHPFIAYELGEAVFNSFQSYSGEIGVRFPNDHLLRLTHMNVNLTEKHLSSSFAGAVDGPNVEGKLFGFEVFYDFPIVWQGLYVGPSIGYYKSDYSHTILQDELKNNYSASIGAGISYRDTNMFGVKGLYSTLMVPMRILLNPVEKTKLGETTIVGGAFDNNIWFFVGYEF